MEIPLPSWFPSVTDPWNSSLWANPVATSGSPIVLDVDASGAIELAALSGQDSVYWDIDSDGFAEASGWIAGGDGLLCAPGANGIVDGHDELFGNNATYANGYLKLAALYDSNGDNAVTAADTNFGDLRVWIDANADGVSQSAELYTLASLGITSIATAYSNVDYTIAGNPIKQQSTFVMNGNTQTSVDAWFSYDNKNTEYAQDYTLDVRTLFLPTLRGYDTLPDLHIAMSMDETLMGLVQDLATQSTSTLLDQTYGLEGKITDILLRWTNADGIDPASRGGNFDARKLVFLEHLLGEAYHGVDSTNPQNPLSVSVPFLQKAWDAAVGTFSATVTLQSGLAGLFGNPVYDPQADAFSGTDWNAAPIIRFDAPGSAPVYASGLHDIWFFKPGDSLISAGGNSVSQQLGKGEVLLADVDSDDVRTWTNSSGDFYIRYTENDQIFFDAGTVNSASDIGTRIERIVFGDGTAWNLAAGLFLRDTDDAHQTIGSSLDDVIEGRGGSDTIYGYAGNDILTGGAGGDYISGGAGNDDYVFSAGDGVSGSYDWMLEIANEGTDRIVLHGINPGDVRMWTESYYDFRLQYSATDVIKIDTASASGGGIDIHQRIEQIVFDDNTVWNFSNGLVMTDSDSAHQLMGTTLNDVIDGRGGNDTLRGFAGNDVLAGGIGGDYMTGGAGNDDYVFSAGDGVSGSYDWIQEIANEGTDRIVLHGINPGDVRMWTESYYDFRIQYSATDVIKIDTASVSGGGTDIYQRIEQIVFDDNTVWNLSSGLVMTDNDSAHQLMGTALNDVIDGRGGGDSLYSYAGNDSLTGGAGSDYMAGGAGNDDYVFSAGDGVSGSYDRIQEIANEGTDRIVLHGINPGDVQMWTEGYYDFRIQYSATDVIRIDTASASGGGIDIHQRIEQIVFDDSTVWNFSNGLVMTDNDSAHQLMGTTLNDVIDGRGGTDSLYGYAGNDILYGGSANDYLFGDSDNDILHGGDGLDNLYGGSGADIFAFEAESAFNNVDVVADFSLTQSDALDLSDLLELYNPVSDAITDFVQITTSGSNSSLFVDRDGLASTYGFTQVATISGVTGLTDETALVSSGNLIVT